MTQYATPIYGVTYADDLEPLANYPAVTQAVATTVEAALKRGGIAPPAASDLAALAGRVSTLETTVGPTEISYAAGFARYADATTWAGVQYNRRGSLVTLSGAMSATASKVQGDLIFTMPAGCRPPFTVQAASAGVPVIITSAGAVKVNGAAASGTIWSFTATWGATS